MTLQPGTRLGSYEIVSLLGAGGMGEVYKAKDLKLGRDVAIKVLREDLASDPERLRRFEQEARAASSLNHPNIVHIYDIGQQDSTRYIAMEYVEGKTLREMLGGEPLPTKKVLHVATQIAEGLGKAHSAGIVHRDLKPENLMVTNDGFVKILDFGLAKLTPQLSEASSEVDTLAKGGTTPGVVMGTVGYMSPEQAKGQPSDFRSDQFSLGTVLYEMATGNRAFRHDTLGETQAAIIRDEPEPITQLNPNLPPPFRWIVERCLAKDPKERYASTQDLAHELQNVRDHIDEVPSAPVVAEPQPTVWLRRAGILTLAGLLVAVLALTVGLNVGGLRERLFGGATPGRIESIVVLPLQNLSGDPEQEYFADGMTEALITGLSKIGALKVISRTSAMRYKGSDKPLPEIARELNVDAVVEGSAMRVGEQVRITAQLIEAATDQHLWAESYERRLQDVLALQSEVAHAIAREIQVRVTTDEESRLVRASPVHPEAYEAVLKGRFLLNQTTEEGWFTAIDYFNGAIENDSDYGPAYAGLADSYIQLLHHQILPPAEAYPKARKAALRAVEIDDTLSDAHTALGLIKLYEWDWSSAAIELERAIELDPGSVSAHLRYSGFLRRMGRFDEALLELGRAEERDPLSTLIRAEIGSVLYCARRYDEAIEQLLKTREMSPRYWASYWFLGWTYAQAHMFEKAVESFREQMTLMKGANVADEMGALAYTYALWGNQAQAQKWIDELLEYSVTHHVSPYTMARAYSGFKEQDQALDWLEKAYAERAAGMIHLKVRPHWDPLRDNPRFQDLLRRMNFPES